MLYKAEVELLEDGEYHYFTVSALNESMRDRAIERIGEDGGEVVVLKEWTEKRK